MPSEFIKCELQIKESYTKLINSYKHLSFLITILNGNNNIYLFGGWLRDTLNNYFHNKTILWQDVDIVVDGEIRKETLPAIKRSNFGGYRFNFASNKKADFWELKETFAFKQNIIPTSIENILKTTVFKMNSLLFDVKNFKLNGDEAIEDIKNKRIRFNCRDYLHIFPELQVYRAYLYATKLGYAIDIEIVNFAKLILSKISADAFLSKILIHKSWVSIEEIEQMFHFYESH